MIVECSLSNRLKHIAFGIPLDFQQGNIEDFRYSTILSLFAQKVEVDYQYCELPEAAKLKGHTQHTTARIDQNVTLEMNEEKVCKTQTDDTMMYPHTSNPHCPVGPQLCKNGR
ncbi:Hypothetical predicted protein [Paramuricea clavata]|uniref:Uncharacterized protein n=1 Tax=Paramuricea clavata TaxID=317549 RepID=A0A7D9DJ12_PARCT|nr:Hypothetical predicted protein [Paramuricea clavata]